MFSKGSRYNKLKDIIGSDAGGRSAASKSLRLLPEVTGTFLHTLEEVDRLDHLAFKYYRQPLKWWHICDANPGYLSPLALLGNEPIAVTGFTVVFTANPGQPVWYQLLARLGQTPGVKDISIEEKVTLAQKDVSFGGQDVTVETEEFTHVVTITYNTLNLSRETLQAVLVDEGFRVDKAGDTGRIGKKITIPPDVAGNTVR